MKAARLQRVMLKKLPGTAVWGLYEGTNHHGKLARQHDCRDPRVYFRRRIWRNGPAHQFLHHGVDFRHGFDGKQESLSGVALNNCDRRPRQPSPFIFGKVDLTKSIYLTTNLGWAGAIIGGILFGFGMVLAGGCGSKTLVRLGAGNLKSLVVALFLGVFAYMTLRGLVGIARLELEGVANIELKSATLQSQGIPDIISSLTGLALPGVRWAVMALFVLGLLWFCFKDQEFRQSPRDISAGLIIGSLVPIGWYITGVIGHDDFEPTRLASLTFVAPVGEDSIPYDLYRLDYQFRDRHGWWCDHRRLCHGEIPRRISP